MKKLVTVLFVIFFWGHIKGQVKPTHFFKDSVKILIPFEFKQSTLYHPKTYEVIDSIADLLLKQKGITLTINGYANEDEGSDTICYYLSLNRALFVRDYILGRGVNADRIFLVKAHGKVKLKRNDFNKYGISINHKVELQLNYPPHPPKKIIADRDGDGIADADDECPDVYGYEENKGCPDKDAVLVPFKFGNAYFSTNSYQALDNVISLLKENPLFKIYIEGHAYETEGTESVCQRLADDRIVIVKNYLLSRNISSYRILGFKNYSFYKPYNAARNSEEEETNARVMLIIKKQ